MDPAIEAYWKAKEALDALPPSEEGTDEYLRLNRQLGDAIGQLSLIGWLKVTFGLRK